MLLSGGDSQIINLGSENGYTNKEIVETVSEVTGHPVNWTYGPRRAGDADSIVASNKKAKEVLGWSPKRDLKSMIESDVRWRNLHPNLYGRQYNKLSKEQREQLLIYHVRKNTKALYEAIETADQDRLEKLIKSNNL